MRSDLEITRLDDFQGWLLRGGGHRLLVDPWLVDELMPGPSWCWRPRLHQQPVPLRPRDVGRDDLLVLSSSRPDHAHRATLTALDRRVRVVGTPAAAALARQLGFASTIALGSDRVVLDGSLALSLVPLPLPYRCRHTAAVLVETLDSPMRVLVAPRRLPAMLPGELDVVLTSVQQLRLLGLPVSGDLDRCLELARAARVRWILASRTDPDRGLGRLGRRLYAPDDMDTAAFRATVAMHLGDDRGGWLKPGESLRVGPRAPAAGAVRRAGAAVDE